MAGFGRLIRSALARRIAYVLAALMLAWLGIGRVHAQEKNCRLEASQCSVAEAEAHCNSYNPLPSPNIDRVTRRLYARGAGTGSGRITLTYWGIRNDTPTIERGAYSGGNFYWVNKCSAEQPYTGVGPWSSVGGGARSGSLGCRNGCEGEWRKNSDVTYTWSALGNICPNDQEGECNSLSGSYWNPVLKVCEPADGKCPGGAAPNSLGQCAPEPCPEGMAQQADGTCKKKDSECPAGNVRSPDGKCLPGDGQCAEGEVRGPDGTCKKDRDGDGEPDPPGDDTPNEFSGGDDCSVPPSCSGDAIMCGQARIQWRIDCNTRRNTNVAGGHCSAMPVCTGEKCDAMEHAQMIMQWRTACAVEKLASRNGDSGGSEGQPEWTKVDGMNTDPGAGSSPDDTKVLTTKAIGVSDLDQSGIGGSGACMGFVSGGGGNELTSGFMNVLASPPPFFCQYMDWIKAAIILLAATVSVVILARGGQ